MAGELPSVPQTGGIGSIVSLITSLAPAFGSGKTTTKTGGTNTTTNTEQQTVKGSLDPNAESQADALLQSILGQNDSAEMEAMVQNILTRAKQEFGPAIGKSLGAGERAYTSTTLKQLGNEAMARASAEAAAAKLGFMNKNNALATQIVDRKMAETSARTTDRTSTAVQTPNTTSTQQTSATPAGKGMGLLGPAAYAYNLYKESTKKNKNTPPDPSKFFGDAAGSSGAFDFASAFEAANPGSAAFATANPSMTGSSLTEILNGTGFENFSFSSLFDAGSGDAFSSIASLLGEPINFSSLAAGGAEVGAAGFGGSEFAGATIGDAPEIAGFFSELGAGESLGIVAGLEGGAGAAVLGTELAGGGIAGLGALGGAAAIALPFLIGLASFLDRDTSGDYDAVPNNEQADAYLALEAPGTTISTFRNRNTGEYLYNTIDPNAIGTDAAD